MKARLLVCVWWSVLAAGAWLRSVVPRALRARGTTWRLRLLETL